MAGHAVPGADQLDNPAPMVGSVHGGCVRRLAVGGVLPCCIAEKSMRAGIATLSLAHPAGTTPRPGRQQGGQVAGSFAVGSGHIERQRDQAQRYALANFWAAGGAN